MGVFSPYNGNEPYIFVSYAHKDYSLVEQFLKCFSENKYRFWYDEGIKSGSEWSDCIVERIDKSRVFLVFISANSVKSENVKDEIHVAVTAKKHILVIRLDDTVLTGGLMLKLDRRQAVNFYDSSLQESFEKVTAISEVNSCIEISTNNVFITYPDSPYPDALKIAERVKRQLSNSNIDAHVDQITKVYNTHFMDLELENGRLNEMKHQLIRWVKEQNEIKSHGCSTMIIILTKDNMFYFGYSVSTARDYYYAAKSEGKQIIFILGNDIDCIPSYTSIPKDIIEEIELFGIPESQIQDTLIGKLKLNDSQ